MEFFKDFFQILAYIAGYFIFTYFMFHNSLKKMVNSVIKFAEQRQRYKDLITSLMLENMLSQEQFTELSNLLDNKTDLSLRWQNFFLFDFLVSDIFGFWRFHPFADFRRKAEEYGVDFESGTVLSKLLEEKR